ncbi:hypothetical protein LOTGIDRAFT_134796, partial [Lottia gigantea]
LYIVQNNCTLSRHAVHYTEKLYIIWHNLIQNNCALYRLAVYYTELLYII